MDNKRKKILIVSTSFPKSPGDGLSPFIWEFCLFLSRLNWDVTALVPHHRGLNDSEEWDGVKVRRFRYLPERFENLGYSGGIMPNIKSRPWTLLKLPFYIFSMYREALALTIEDEFDIVNFHWIFPASFWLPQFMRSSGKPVVLTGHGTDILLARKSIFRFIANRSLPKAQALTVNSEYMKSQLEANILPADTRAIFVGVDGDKFNPRGNKPSQSKTVLYVGRLIKQKGIDLLIEAFIEARRQFPDARLEIIGYGAEQENIQRLIEKSGVGSAVKITPMIPHDDLPEIFRKARLLALPSVIPEGLGITVAEAGLCGVPSVTFGLGGTKEIVIDGQTGLIVTPGREELIAALVKILGDDGFADKLGQNALVYLRGVIGWPNIAAKYDALFRQIIANWPDKQEKASKKSALAIAVILLLLATGYAAKMFFDRFERLLGLFR